MAKIVARVLGIIFIVLGIIGFFLPFSGVMDLTLTHNLIHLILGIVLVAVSGKEKTSQTLSTIIGAIFLIIGIVGFFVQDLGLLTLDLTDNIIHVIAAIILLYAGLAKSTSA